MHPPYFGFLLIAILLAAAPFSEFEERIARLKKQHKVEPIQNSIRKNSPAKVIALGKELFHDKRLSKNNNVSCATCHMAEKGFSNGVDFAQGTNGTTLTRHVPHLYNLDYNTAFFWDGRATSLEEQLSMVVKSKNELNFDFKGILERLQEDSNVTQQFNQVFPRKGLTKATLTETIVAYERSIVAGNSRYDRYLSGEKDALNDQELEGLDLFTGQANCIACHFGPNLSDNSFHNIGIKTTDLGRQLVDKIGMNKEFESTPYPFFSTFKAFKTPSLRNVSLSAPYFHNGSKQTLEEVVAFYNAGGENPNTAGLAKEIVTLNLSVEQQAALVAFLKSLESGEI